MLPCRKLVAPLQRSHVTIRREPHQQRAQVTWSCRHAGGARELLLLLDAEEKLRRQNDMAIKRMSRIAISNFASSALVKLNSSRASDTAPAGTYREDAV
ncbi:hypothetical protein HBH56_065180 [Parastagonospora nodorum]|nr:hypothetical protein HBH56_065180 [Parastagonospora nodorum]KAH3986414.1 hypothetical protein HBH52_042670 [Parastagonospora nodorum]KAH4040201.1 hypothetical protein HBI09_025000 [Parastagonospora nodorum]KAH4165439.1 hypothetical protein HBH44_065410 [Parastagonospora nodorum]KAH4167345.1 hypothetical protein HBH43_127060 [Parastagonospora nodorum]